MNWIDLIFGPFTSKVFSVKGDDKLGPDPTKLEDFNYPTADEDRCITQIFGKCKIYPNILTPLYNYIYHDRTKHDQTVGYSYFASFLLGIGAEIDSIEEFRIDDEVKATPDSSGSFTCLTGNPGTVRGYDTPSTVYWTDGSQVTMPWQACIDASGSPTAYKGISLMWFQDCFIGDDISTLPKYSVVVKHCERILNPLTATNYSDINDDANPADILYFILTRMMGISTSLINTSVWEAVHIALYNEGMGLSIPMNTAKSGKAWINEIERHIDGRVYMNSEGKYEIALTRDDYTVGTLPEVTLSHIEDVEFYRPSWRTVFSDIIVKWTSKWNYELTPYKLNNPAGRDILGQQKSETLSFPYITKASVVSKAISRIYRRYFYPLATGKFNIPDFVADDLSIPFSPGSVFKFTCSALSINQMVGRVVAGNSTSGTRIEVEFTEDIFDSPDLIVIPEPPAPPDPSDKLVGNPIVRDAYPAFYKDGPSLVCFGTEPGTITSNAFTCSVEMVRHIGPGMGVMRWTQAGTHRYCGYGTLVAELADTLSFAYTGFEIENAVDVAAFAHTDAEWHSCTRLAIIDNGAPADYEIVSVKTCVASSGNYVITGLLRGIGGTPRNTHPIGSPVYILPVNTDNLIDISALERIHRTTARLAPVTLQGKGADTDIVFTSAITSMTGLTPDNFTANTLTNTLSWQHRCRMAGATIVDPDYITAIDGPFDDGYFNIYRDGNKIAKVIDADSYTHALITTGHTYTIKQFITNGYESAVATVVT